MDATPQPHAGERRGAHNPSLKVTPTCDATSQFTRRRQQWCPGWRSRWARQPPSHRSKGPPVGIGDEEDVEEGRKERRTQHVRLVKKKRRNATTDDDVDDKDCINDASPTPETNSHTHTQPASFSRSNAGAFTPHTRARAPRSATPAPRPEIRVD